MEKIYAVVRHPVTEVLIKAVMSGGAVYVCDVLVGKAAKRHPTVNEDRISSQLSGIAQQIRSFLDGDATDLSTIPVDLSDCTSFRRMVLETARRIPYGSCVSYSELAKMAGAERAVRAVASVMRRNRLPLVIPCHRVIQKNGRIGAYCGDADGKDALLKTRLIALENQVNSVRTDGYAS
jgi:O-6-methylguanine DNA methyltransferase